ncbi:MAG: porin family protein [Candidatus Cryptobacteroides sp.]
MKRYIKLSIFLLLLCTAVSARDKKTRVKAVAEALDTVSYSDEYLDTVNVKKSMTINDYTLLGVHYGVGLNQMSWSPSMEQKMLFTPVNVGVSWTRYGKMFGYMPYFGIQIGALYTKEGYKLEEGYKVQGASTAIMQILEVPVLAHIHYDFWKMKLMVNIGFYGAYRLSIQRIGDSVRDEYEHNFTETDYRWDYGIKGGAGFGFVFDPVEIHFNAWYKYGFGSLYKANYYSEYYYRFATASNFAFTIGLHFQITKRIGKTNHQLKKEAKTLFDSKQF